MPVASEATQHIFGHTVFDDITGNGMRSEDLFQYYALYASADDPDKLAVSCKVGGEIVAQDSTRFYNYKVAEIVSFISQFRHCSPVMSSPVVRRSNHLQIASRFITRTWDSARRRIRSSGNKWISVNGVSSKPFCNFSQEPALAGEPFLFYIRP